MTDDTYQKLAEGATKLLGRPVDPAELRGEQPVEPLSMRGNVAAGQWLALEFEPDPESFDRFPVVPDPRFQAGAQFGLIVQGTSINRVASQGDILHCVDYDKLKPRQRDLVIVEWRKAQEGLKEVTAKRYSLRGRVTTLSPDSTDPKWQPIVFDEDKPAEGEAVETVAVVIGIYKPLR